MAVPAAAFAQHQPTNPLIGAWERISVTMADGRLATAPSAFLIFTPDGFFAQLSIPPGRPKIEKPLDQLTREEFVALFTAVAVGHGTYDVKGDQASYNLVHFLLSTVLLHKGVTSRVCQSMRVAAFAS